MKNMTLAILFVVGATICNHLFADQAADEMEIRKAVDAYAEAFNRRDAKAVAGMWSPEAVYLNRETGEQVTGREEIQQQFHAIFTESPGVTCELSTESVQFISPNVAVESGTGKIIRPGEELEESPYTAVYVKRDGVWLLDRVTDEGNPIVLSNYEHLKELEWMIGEWVDQDDEATVVTSCQWTKNRNFITRMFSVAIGDQVQASGLQIVGWDPSSKQIRSWVFDSDGGFGEGRWSHKGNRWFINTTGVTPSGNLSSSMNIISYVDKDTYTWQSVERAVAGELLPNQDEVVVVRQTATQ